MTLAEGEAAAISVAAAAAISNVLDSRGDLEVAPNLLSSQFLPSRLQLAQALLLGCQFLTLILNNLRPGPGNKRFVRELALYARNLPLRLSKFLIEAFQFFVASPCVPGTG